MAVKVLVTAIGQQIVTEAKQIENKDTGELVGYWMDNPRLIGYTQSDNDEKGMSVNFGPYCLVSDEASFSIRSEHIVAILEPRQDVVDAYVQLVAPDEEAKLEVIESHDVPDSVDAEGSDVPDSAGGAAGDGAEVPSV